MEIIAGRIPDLVKKTVHEIDKESEVILFGSRARGDYDLDSDWDFLILLSRRIDTDVEDNIRNQLYEIELELEEVITSIIEEKSEWEKYDQTMIYKNIEEQGIPLKISV